MYEASKVISVSGFQSPWDKSKTYPIFVDTLYRVPSDNCACDEVYAQKPECIACHETRYLEESIDLSGYADNDLGLRSVSG